MNTLFLGWQAPERQWHTIGRLTREDGGPYTFVYTNGVNRAKRESGFHPLLSFPDLKRKYESKTLFPLFSNRLLSRSRPDYRKFISWLNVDDQDGDLKILARSGGHRATDTLEIFSAPEEFTPNQYRTHFFIRGLSHAAPSAIERANRLKPREALLVMHDLQNPCEPQACSLRTSEGEPGDMHLLGYCPRYLAGEIVRALQQGDRSDVCVSVAHVNPPPTPIQFRVLCEVKLSTPNAWHFFSGGEFEPYSNGENGR
jgi:hypothetical protein